MVRVSSIHKSTTFSGASARKLTLKNPHLLLSCLVVAIFVGVTALTEQPQFLARFRYIATTAGMMDAMFALCLDAVNKVSRVPYYEAFTPNDIEWHRKLLTRQFRGVIAYKQSVAIITSKILEQTPDPYEFVDTVNDYEEATSISLTFFVGHKTLRKYPSLARRLAAPRDAVLEPVDKYAPTTYYIHGGGFVYLNTFAYEKLLRRLAEETETVVVAINYRQPPEHPFPVPVNDCIGGFGWLQKNAYRLGLDGQRIVVAGDSAGGNLAISMLATAISEPDRIPWAGSVSFLGLIYPVICVIGPCESGSRREFADIFFTRTEAVKYFATQYVNKRSRESWKAQPMEIPLSVLRRFPPTIFNLAHHDTLRDEGIQFYKRIQGSGVATTIDITHGVHGLFGSDVSAGGNTAFKKYIRSLHYFTS